MNDNTSTIIDFIDEPSSQKVDNQILIEGRYFYKASVIRQLFNSSSASRDCLNRVQGMSKYLDSEDKVRSIEDVFFVGAPILTLRPTPEVAAIRKIKVGGKKRKFLNGDELQNENTALKLQKIDLKEDGDKLFWMGGFRNNKFEEEGRHCRSFQPKVETAADGKTFHVFSKSFVG